jgi:TatD DNase family protein
MRLPDAVFPEATLLIDSHAHLDSERYAVDRAAMLARAWEAGVGTVLSIGIGEQAAGMHRALDVCREFNGQFIRTTRMN